MTRATFIAVALFFLVACGDDGGPMGPTTCPETPPGSSGFCGREGLTCTYPSTTCPTDPDRLLRFMCSDSGDGFLLWIDNSDLCSLDGGLDASDASDAGDAGDAGDASDTSVDADGPVPCGTTMCTADEYCVVPCCGGAAPPCLPREPDGSCPAGTSDTGMCLDSSECQADPCTPPPPSCYPRSMCTGDTCPPQDGCGGGAYDPGTRTYSCICA